MLGALSNSVSVGQSVGWYFDINTRVAQTVIYRDHVVHSNLTYQCYQMTFPSTRELLRPSTMHANVNKAGCSTADTYTRE